MTEFRKTTRRLVTDRAQNRCEYCRLSQAGQEATFHIDHVVPKSRGGTGALANLALACVSCSLRKAARTTLVDPDSGVEVSVFNPRIADWSDHFEWRGVTMEALTATGRATITGLDLNRPSILEIRQEEQHRGRFPPPSLLQRKPK